MKRLKESQAKAEETEPETTTEPQKDFEVVDARSEPRIPTQLRTIVQVKEDADNVWKETTNVTTLSKNGAGFSLSRPCSIGRLVTVVLPMPADMRAYDHFEPLYPVMGLVQYCNEGELDGAKCYQVGVAFIGKQVPHSFKDNPQQNYRICGMSETGLWSIVETQREFKARKHPRFWVTLDVGITILHHKKKAIYKEQAVTQNIGASGAAVQCSLTANTGDKVKFACKAYDFYSVAVVRNRKERDGQTVTLHLEFLDNEFPMDKLFLAQSEISQVEQKSISATETSLSATETSLSATETSLSATETSLSATETSPSPPPKDQKSADFDFQRF